MIIQYDHAKADDIDDIMHIESSCFTPEEAATRESMIERIATIPDTFIVARNEEGRAIGMAVGPVVAARYITDDLFRQSHKNRPEDKVQTIISLAVLKAYQKLGVAKELLDTLAAVDQKAGRDIISLTCLKALIPYYEAHGFVNEGLSESQHAGETWYNMVRELRK